MGAFQLCVGDWKAANITFTAETKPSVCRRKTISQVWVYKGYYNDFSSACVHMTVNQSLSEYIYIYIKHIKINAIFPILCMALSMRKKKKTFRVHCPA